MTHHEWRFTIFQRTNFNFQLAQLFFWESFFHFFSYRLSVNDPDNFLTKHLRYPIEKFVFVFCSKVALRCFYSQRNPFPHDKSLPGGSNRWYESYCTHRIHVWYIYLHLVNIHGINVGKYSIHGVVWMLYGVYGVAEKSSQLFETCWPVVTCRIRKRNSHRIPWIPGLPAYPPVTSREYTVPQEIIAGLNFVLKSCAQWLRILF